MTSSNGGSVALPSARSSLAFAASCWRQSCMATVSVPLATKLTPVCSVSAKENPATTLTDWMPDLLKTSRHGLESPHRIVSCSGAGGWPNDGSVQANLLGADATHKRLLKQLSCDAGSLASIGVWVLTITHETVGERGHARSEVRMKIEDPKQRQLCSAHARPAGD